jgi:hypothetical protein
MVSAWVQPPKWPEPFNKEAKFYTVNLYGKQREANKTWRHLIFFEHTCLLHCSVPRIRTSEGKVRLVNVPWARKNSGFTLLFEALNMERFY